MIFNKLTLNDFGVFRGRQSISLAPQPSKPIILFGGKNGAGKSSLLEAIRLCLYGPLALSQRSSKEAYLTYLGSRIHSNPAYLIQPKFSSLSLEFQYADIDAVHTYEITRSWERRSSGNLVEQLDLQRDGRPIDELDSSHWQDFVRELIPPGLSQLFFFDGEKIQQLAEDTSDQQTLSEAIKSLLGLDVIERLQTDTSVYISRLPQQGSNDDQNREEETLRSEIDQIDAIVEQLRNHRTEHERQIAELQSAIASLERKIASEGGSFAKNREELFEKQGTLKANIKLCEESLKDECAGLLPFALIPNLCAELKEQLDREELASQRQAGKQFLRAGRKELLKRLDAPELWKQLHAPANEKQVFRKRLKELINAPLKAEIDPNAQAIHQLSPATQRQLFAWIESATTELPRSIKTTGVQLESLHRELDSVESHLRKVPPEEILTPLLKDMNSLHEQLTDASKQLLLTEEEIKRTELKLADVKRKHIAVCERIQAAAGHSTKIRLVHNLQSVLEKYKSELLTRKIAQIEATVSHCFNTLCRKKDTLQTVRINPKNFAVTLFDKRDQAIPKERLSAGEKQIYAVSMLWALGKTSGRPLPVIIDTPLARLDSDHRRLLINNYFPEASHQTMILSTDTEVDQSYFSELKRGIAHSYRLEFDPKENCTKVASGYFWRSVDEAR